MKYIDLTHTIVDNMPVFPGDPAMTLKQVSSVEANGFTDHLLATNMHVATHIDAPLHMIAGGKRISEIPLDQFVGTGVLVDVRRKSEITSDVLKDKKLDKHTIVLLLSGYSKHYKTPEYDQNYPRISLDFAEELVSRNVKILGLDFINPDTDESFPVHKKLLGNDILIIENLTNLEGLLKIQTFEVIAIPLKLHTDASPVRVVAKVF